MEYDAAGRLVKVRDGYGAQLAAYTYGASNQRLIAEEGGQRTYYAATGGSVLAEYTEAISSSTPQWRQSYVYLGGRLLATVEHNGGAERTQYHHPDRLGTRLTTNQHDQTTSVQATLPFGNVLSTETSAVPSTSRRFTSYDRSQVTRLDYAVNRHYDPVQGRFTSVDPIGMAAVNLAAPQSLNLYAYCQNDPVNFVDPSGLGFFSFFKKIFKAIGKAVFAVAKAIFSVLSNKWVRLIIGVALLFLATPFSGALLFAEGAGAGGIISTTTAGLLMAGVQTLGVISSHVQRRQQEEVGGGDDCGTEDNPCGPVTIQVSGRPLGAVGPLIQIILRIIARIFQGGLRFGRTAPRIAPLLSRSIQFTARQLQAKFKHAPDFGVTGNYNAANAVRFQSAIEQHVANPATQVIQGTYRGQSVVHHLDPATGLNVIKDTSGYFVSGWRLSPAQLQNVVMRGSL